MTEHTTTAPIHFELDVQPQTAILPWHAVLRRAGGDERVEFDSPLALARHLAQFLAPESNPQRGLR